jgi:CubicO group peptidase (beta-lactamase class C family)
MDHRCVLPSQPVASFDQRSFIDHLDYLIPRGLARYGIPGSTVALVSGGSVVWSQGYGLADRARAIPMAPETILQVASISKSIAAWGVMRLVEQEKLDLDKPVEHYLNRWHFPRQGYDPAGVTIRRLLCHSAGLNTPDFPGHSPTERLPSLEESLCGQAGAKRAVTIIRQPGRRFVYSDADYTILQLLIEEVTTDDFAAFMQREVLIPLGMRDSSFEWSPDLEARMAVSYDPQGRRVPRYRYTEKAANGLHTTAPDLARFLAAWMPGPQGEQAGRSVLSPATIEQMINERVEIPGFEGWVYAESYGLGCFSETASNGKQILSHMGGYLGWRSNIALIPDVGEGIIILSNSDLGHELFADVLNAWSDWLAISRWCGAVLPGFYLVESRGVADASAPDIPGYGEASTSSAQASSSGHIGRSTAFSPLRLAGSAGRCAKYRRLDRPGCNRSGSGGFDSYTNRKRR